MRLEHVTGVNSQIDAITFRSDGAQRFALEAEDFGAYHNVGEQMIQRVAMSGCSSGHILYGLDVPTEWTEYRVAIETAGTYELVMICRGDTLANYSLKLLLTNDVAVQPRTWGAIKVLYE